MGHLVWEAIRHVADIRSVEEAIRRRALELMRLAMEDVTAETIDRTPIGTTHQLVDSISSSEPTLIGSSATAILSAIADHAAFVRDGTPSHPITSHGAWPLRNRETGQIFGRQVQHPGTRPNTEWWSEQSLRDRFNVALARNSN